MDLWRHCAGEDAIQRIGGRFRRLVESQEQVATSRLVDDFEEQAMLESLIEANKPRLPADCRGLHYLFATPFRYPPLRRGSRFGGRHDPGLFYASRSAATAMTEVAYYRLLFISGMETPPPGHRLLSQHTLFSGRYATDRGIRLQAPPFAAHRRLLADPASYRVTQSLGRAMREAGVEGFEYLSARHGGQALNIALIHPRALCSKAPEERQNWLCETRPDAVTFYSNEIGEVVHLPARRFLVDGRLPSPAT